MKKILLAIFVVSMCSSCFIFKKKENSKDDLLNKIKSMSEEEIALLLKSIDKPKQHQS